MGWITRLAPLGLVVGLLVLPQPAAADGNWKTSSAIWKVYDLCSKAAMKQYPDYTPTGNANREKARADCLRAYNLPVEGSSLPPAGAAGPQR